MCLSVWPKGVGSDKGTHLGVFFHLMRGEFDDQLKWPFRGAIPYQLVDQKGNKDHIVRRVLFPHSLPDSVTKRVTKEERNQSGVASPEGIAMIYLDIS